MLDDNGPKRSAIGDSRIFVVFIQCVRNPCSIFPLNYSCVVKFRLSQFVFEQKCSWSSWSKYEFCIIQTASSFPRATQLLAGMKLPLFLKLCHFLLSYDQYASLFEMVSSHRIPMTRLKQILTQAWNLRETMAVTLHMLLPYSRENIGVKQSQLDADVEVWGISRFCTRQRRWI